MKNRRSQTGRLWILGILSVGVLAAAIVLIISAEFDRGRPVPKDIWRVIIGGILSFLSFTSLVSALTVIGLSNRDEKNSLTPIPGLMNPYQAFKDGKITHERYNIIFKKEIIAQVISVALATALVKAWFNTFSVMLALCMIIGGAGALVLLKRGKEDLKAMAFITGCILGIFILCASGVDTSKHYTYHINGIKVGKGNGAFTSIILGVLSSTLLFGGLILGISYLITYTCSRSTKFVTVIEEQSNAELTDISVEKNENEVSDQCSASEISALQDRCIS